MPEPIIIQVMKEAENHRKKAVSAEDFALEDIVKTDEGHYNYIGLELPDGRWKELTFAGTTFLEGTADANKKYANWIPYSEKGAVYENGLWRPAEAKDTLVFHITPAKVRYWGMRGAYEHRNTKDARLKKVVNELRLLYKKDGTHPLQYNADSVNWVAGKNGLVTVNGWPNNHPFVETYEIPPSPDDKYYNEIKVGCGLDDVLEKLIGDANPARVKEVFEWIYEQPSKTTYLWRLKKEETAERAVVFGFNNDYANFNTYDVVNGQRPARGVAADEKNFERR